MTRTCGSAVVAGHICLDIIPQFDPQARIDAKSLFQPGSLTKVGPAIISPGGVVSNAGLLLHRLGIPTTLIAKTGDDFFGQTIRRIISDLGEGIECNILVDPEVTTSYSVIINPPGYDRMFFHCPGANDTFEAQNILFEKLANADLFHFGYPPVMKRIYANQGEELQKMFRLAKDTGITTSLDLCMPDPSTKTEAIDWLYVLSRTLPYVDIFLPSLDELIFMLDRKAFWQIQRSADLKETLLQEHGTELLSNLGHRLLEMGAKIVLIKLGDCGAYLCSGDHSAIARLGRAGPAAIEAWANQELWAPCFRVKVIGTTGAGDSTIAGFLSALLRGFSPVGSLTSAVAVGAYNVEAADALSGVPTWDEVQSRIHAGWDRLKHCLAPPGWAWSEVDQLWVKGRTLE